MVGRREVGGIWDTCGFATVIRAEALRVKDEKGQTATVAVPWAEKFSRFTRGFEAFGVEVLQTARSLRAAWRQLLSEFFAFRSFFFQFSHELALPIEALFMLIRGVFRGRS
jgi:hypothetical protein